MAWVWTIISMGLTVSYPLVMWWGETHIEPRIMAVLLLAACIARIPTMPRPAGKFGWIVGGVLLISLAVVGNSFVPLRMYPVFVSGTMLALFGQSVWKPPSMVERVARIRKHLITPDSVRYMRRVTMVWCGFFVINGLISCATALWASPRVWSLYNGVIAYVLMGLLFAGEYLVRMRALGKHHG